MSEFLDFSRVAVGAHDINAPAEIQIIFPRGVALDLNSVMDLLFQVFPDHETVLLSETEDRWILGLRWSLDPRTFVDPKALSTAARLWGISHTEIGSYRQVHHWAGRDVIVSLLHSWALLAPSRAIAERRRPILWIVHFDDHTDLMPAFLGPLDRPGLLRDEMFRDIVDVGSPKSVAAAVRRGTISKGNFLTAYLLAYPACRVVHVGCDVVAADSRLQRKVELVDLGGSEFARFGFELDYSSLEPWTFRQTQSIPTSLQVSEQDGVWLDIDLDYFWNRYDGDSDLRFEVALRGEREEVMRRLTRFLTELRSATWVGNIEAVSVAVSPGFFPADYWIEVMSPLLDGLKGILRSNSGGDFCSSDRE